MFTYCYRCEPSAAEIKSLEEEHAEKGWPPPVFHNVSMADCCCDRLR